MEGKATSSNNPLIVSGISSSNVQLHPLVLLTISDYITKHTIRQQQGPVVGAVIGEQNGRNFTLEHAFQCKLVEQADSVMLDSDWFQERLDMYKEVHKVPALDLVALFALGPVEGPQPAHLPVLRQVRDITGSDSIMLLLFHPELVDNLHGGKLPISLYESVEEMEEDQIHLRFRELAFEVETSDAEMIGVNSVAVAGGTATAVQKADQASSASTSTAKDKKAKGKGKAKEGDEKDTNGSGPHDVLSPEDDELISTLNSKVNAIKMLNERLQLIQSYLETLPASYLTDSSTTDIPPDSTNFALLRNMNSLLSRLPLLAPPRSSAEGAAAAATMTSPTTAMTATKLQQAGETQKQDVHLTSLLAGLTRSLSEAHNLSSKFQVLQREKQAKDRNQFPRGRMGEESVFADPSAF